MDCHGETLAKSEQSQSRSDWHPLGVGVIKGRASLREARDEAQDAQYFLADDWMKRERILDVDAEIAETFLERTKGLLGRDGNVVKVVWNIRPWRPWIWGGWRTVSVLETAATEDAV